MPVEARTPCAVHVIPADAKDSDLDYAYVQRGADIMKCDAARSLAVSIHDAEHALETQYAKDKAAREKPWWRFW